MSTSNWVTAALLVLLAALGVLVFRSLAPGSTESTLALLLLLGAAALAVFGAWSTRSTKQQPGDTAPAPGDASRSRSVEPAPGDDQAGAGNGGSMPSTPGGDDLPVAIDAQPALGGDDHSRTQLPHTHEASIAIQKVKADFAAVLSHEVRTPMNAVLGMLDLLRLTALTRKQQTYVHIMENSSSMLLSLLDNMIDLGSLESGELVLREDTFRATDLLESVLEIMGYQAQVKGLELAGEARLDIDTEITGDFVRLRQILINLIGNAIKFTETGEIVVSFAVTNDSDDRPLLSVTVRDTGIGMSAEEVRSLFSPGQPISAARRPGNSGHGNGLGLVLSRKLVALMGGSMSCESHAGEGTEIGLEVPVGRAPGMETWTREFGKLLSDRRLVVHSEHQTVAASICSFLQDWNVDCEAESNPLRVEERLAAAAASGKPIDCIVIDAEQETGGRISTARDIRRQTDLPILLLAPISQPLRIGEISDIGNVRCINKPVLPGELRGNLAQLLRKDDEAKPQASNDALSSMRILVAEDNPLNRKVLLSMLASLGLEADTVKDGPSVLTALTENPYDLILMDCQMPGMDGDQVTNMLRARAGDDYSHPIIVAVTADVSKNNRERCLAAGMDDFLAKPVRLGLLRSGLQRWAGMVDERKKQAVASAGISGDPDLGESLLERTGFTDITSFSEYIDLFVEDTSSRIETLRAALEEKNLEEIRRECHALKGACLEMGASQLGLCCDSLGRASRDNRMQDLPDAFERLEKEFNRIRPVIEAEKRQAF